MSTSKIYALTRDILDAHGYAGYERHHYRGREMSKVIGEWNNVIGIGVIPLSSEKHNIAHTATGKKNPFVKLTLEESYDILAMMDEQITAIIARPDLWREIRGGNA